MGRFDGKCATDPTPKILEKKYNLAPNFKFTGAVKKDPRIVGKREKSNKLISAEEYSRRCMIPSIVVGSLCLGHALFSNSVLCFIRRALLGIVQI